MEKEMKCRLYTVTTTRPVEMTKNAGGVAVYFKISATMVGQQRNIFSSNHLKLPKILNICIGVGSTNS